MSTPFVRLDPIELTGTPGPSLWLVRAFAPTPEGGIREKWTECFTNHKKNRPTMETTGRL